jgi:hypothetical protein
LSSTLAKTVDHMLNHVLPAVAEYEAAEANLSAAHASGNWEKEANNARRKASELAVAVDGLTDRANRELGIQLESIRAEVSALCTWPGSTALRNEAFERVYGVANAYKHSTLTKKSHVLNSFEDVLAVGRGFGTDAFGIGKYSGVEVLVRDKSGQMRVFSADAATVVSAWFRFLSAKGATLPAQSFTVCGVVVHPDAGHAD